MRKVTMADIKNINYQYLQLKTYAGVARATGFSPSTVKKYIIPNFHIVKDEQKNKFTGTLPNINMQIFDCEEWGSLFSLTSIEKAGISDLWKEMEF